MKVGGQRVLVPVDDDENLCVLDLVGAKLFQLFTPDDRFKVGNPVLRVRDDKSQIFLITGLEPVEASLFIGLQQNPPGRVGKAKQSGWKLEHSVAIDADSTESGGLDF